jgi:hypothetical protein
MPKPVVVASKLKQIEWAPINTPVRVTFLGSSYDAISEALSEAFGEFPIRLKLDILHTSMLAAMAAAAGEGRQPYEEIKTALERYGELELRVL